MRTDDNVLTATLARPVAASDTRAIVRTSDGTLVALRRMLIKNDGKVFANGNKTWPPFDPLNVTSEQHFVLSLYQITILEKDIIKSIESYDEKKNEQVTLVSNFYKGVFDDAYKEAVRMFSIALKKIAPTDRPTMGIITVMSEECGGGGTVYITGFNRKTRLIRQIAEWSKTIPDARIEVTGDSVYFHGIRPDPLIYVADKDEVWKEIRCMMPRKRALNAFLNHIRKNGFIKGCECARVKSLPDEKAGQVKESKWK